MKRAEYSFRRQLDKNNKKHADELAARDKENAELKARLAEIEKKLDPQNVQRPARTSRAMTITSTTLRSAG